MLDADRQATGRSLSGSGLQSGQLYCFPLGQLHLLLPVRVLHPVGADYSVPGVVVGRMFSFVVKKQILAQNFEIMRGNFDVQLWFRVENHEISKLRFRVENLKVSLRV